MRVKEDEGSGAFGALFDSAFGALLSAFGALCTCCTSAFGALEHLSGVSSVYTVEFFTLRLLSRSINPFNSRRFKAYATLLRERLHFFER